MQRIKKLDGLKGEILCPGDKSISHRAVMLGALADGDTVIEGFLKGDDCLSTIKCFESLGVKTDINEDKVIVHGKGLYGLSKPESVLYTGNSGTTTRLLLGILSAQKFSSTITGDSSIQKRPMNRVMIPLEMMGAKIKGDYCPLSVEGSSLKGINYKMPVASAQVKTAILLAGLYAKSETVICEVSKSRDHTELMLKSMGANISVDGLNIVLKPGKVLKPLHIKVPADISSAAFFMAAAAIMKNSLVLIKNVGVNPTRTGIIDVMIKMGADITLLSEHLENNEPVCDILVKSSSLKAVTISGDIIPRLIDEIPIIAVMAACAEGRTVIKDAKELKVKETNRIDAVCCELKKCGVDITATDDGMIINGSNSLKGASFKSYQDHRMAMSLTVLSQVIDSPCTIDDTECMNISYPNFLNDFYSLGI